MRMLNPPHPGAFVKTEVIEPQGLTIATAAKVLGVSRPALSTFLNGRSARPIRASALTGASPAVILNRC